jgi:hypothetical protein
LIEPVGGVVDELLASLDALGAEDLTPLFGPALLERLRPLLAAQNRLAAEVARTVREAEVSGAAEVDGLKTMASWLRGHGHLSAAEAGRVVRAGRACTSLPAVAAAFAAGVVTAEQVAVISPVAAVDNVAAAAAQGVDLAAVDAVLAQAAASRPHARLGPVVGHYLARLDPDGPEPDPTEGRSLTVARDLSGGLSGRFRLDAVGGEKLCAALESVVQADRPAGGRRTRAQRLGDALVQLADVALAVGAMISAARARWLACDAGISRIVFGPDGAPTELGRTHRVVPPQLRRAVEVRDRHCVFAGCAAPTHWCDVHHLVHWIDDGATTLDNSALLCERHHTKVHHGFRIERPTRRAMAHLAPRRHRDPPDGRPDHLTPSLGCEPFGGRPPAAARPGDRSMQSLQACSDCNRDAA